MLTELEQSSLPVLQLINNAVLRQAFIIIPSRLFANVVAGLLM